MRWQKNRRLGILVLFSIIALFLVAACQGSDGDQGGAGSKGDPGAPGAPGSQGDVGSQGEKGDTGSRGRAGSEGSVGPTGDPGENTSAAVVLVSDSVTTANPAFQVWGSGFTAGDSYSAQIWDGANPVNLTHTSAEAVTVSSGGAIGGSWSTSVSPGLYTVAVTDASGVMATAPLVVERVVVINLRDTVNPGNEVPGGSGQTGTATLIWRGGSTTTVIVEVTAGISELNHIHNGQCQTLGSVAYQLNNTSGGPVTSVVNVALSAIQDGNYAINAHKKASPGQYTSCGNIPAQ